MVVCDIVLNTLLFTEMWYSGRESGDSGGGMRIRELNDNLENEYVTGIVGNLAVLYLWSVSYKTEEILSSYLRWWCSKWYRVCTRRR